MSILKELNTLKEKSEETEIKNLKSESFAFEIEHIFPYAVKYGIENFKKNSIESLYQDVLSFVVDKNFKREKDLEEQVKSIISEIENIKLAHQNYYQIDNSLLLNNSDNFDNLKNKDPKVEEKTISSLSVLKNKVSNFFKSEDTQENKLKK